MREFWYLFFQIVAVILMFGWTWRQLTPSVLIWLSARRMKIRDKGAMEPFKVDGVWKVWMHTFCNTRFRIGIDKTGQAVRYCWRCEFIVPNSSGPGPNGRKDIPLDNGVLIDIKDKNVLRFPDRNAA